MQLNNAWRILVLGIALALSFTACSSDDDNNRVTTKQMEISFGVAESTNFIELGDSPNYQVDGNVPDWLTILHEKANQTNRLKLTAVENTGKEKRESHFTISTPSTVFELNISQAKLTQRGIYILSEGTWKTKKSDIAYYDITNDKLYPSYFSSKNGRVLGDVGNDIVIYGSKMYCLVSEQNIGTNDGIIEIIDPRTCKSIKQIPFVVDKASKQQDIPRRFVFEGGKGYITGFSGYIARLDTLTLELDAVTKLEGENLKTEGITIYHNKLYAANSGYGEGKTVSVIDKESLKELYKIESPINPVNILTVKDKIYLQTAYTGEPSNLYILDPKTEKVGDPFNVSATKLAVLDGHLYTGDMNWSEFEDQISRINLETREITPITFNSKDMYTVYSFDSNPTYKEIYIGNMGRDVVITDAQGKVIKKFKVEVPYINKIIPIVW